MPEFKPSLDPTEIIQMRPEWQEAANEMSKRKKELDALKEDHDIISRRIDDKRKELESWKQLFWGLVGTHTNDYRSMEYKPEHNYIKIMTEEEIEDANPFNSLRDLFN